MQTQENSRFTSILIAGAIGLLILGTIAMFAARSYAEEKYRLAMRDLLTERQSAHELLDRSIKESDNDAQFIAQCTIIEKKYGDLVGVVSSIAVPARFSSSHQTIKNAIIELESGASAICDGVRTDSQSSISEGIVGYKESLQKLTTGASILASSTRTNRGLQTIFVPTIVLAILLSIFFYVFYPDDSFKLLRAIILGATISILSTLPNYLGMVGWIIAVGGSLALVMRVMKYSLGSALLFIFVVSSIFQVVYAALMQLAR
ncbi:MAG: hypothetical protein AAB365_01275 [Patescibacteria group bacterium]